LSHSRDLAVAQKHEEMLDKMRQVEAEYNIVKKPLYAARANVIRRIPGFWLHCFLQHADLRLILGGVDQDILAYLEEVPPPPSFPPFLTFLEPSALRPHLKPKPHVMI
jgi:hypothetical protein